MGATARLDLKLNPTDKATFARAADIQGLSMADFVRRTLKEKASELINQEHRVIISALDFDAFAAAIEKPFKPNKALKKAISEAGKVKRA